MEGPRAAAPSQTAWVPQATTLTPRINHPPAPVTASPASRPRAGPRTHSGAPACHARNAHGDTDSNSEVVEVGARRQRRERRRCLPLHTSHPPPACQPLASLHTAHRMHASVLPKSATTRPMPDARNRCCPPCSWALPGSCSRACDICCTCPPSQHTCANMHHATIRNLKRSNVGLQKLHGRLLHLVLLLLAASHYPPLLALL